MRDILTQAPLSSTTLLCMHSVRTPCIHAIIVPELPFGGVGASGVGAYHGKHTFLAFSHAQAGMWRGEGGEWINGRTRYTESFEFTLLFWCRYPPLNDSKVSWLEKLMWYKPSKGHFGY